MCEWVDWKERPPHEGEAGFVIFRNLVSKSVWVQTGTVITGRYWYDNEPLAWMPYPIVPEQYANTFVNAVAEQDMKI